MTIKLGDFIEVTYTGSVDSKVFDTTNKQIAQKNSLPLEGFTFEPAVICVGENQLVAGLDSDLVGKDISKEYEVIIVPELAFGKRDIKKIRIIPASTFKDHKVMPRPGLQVDIDGQRGIISRVAGGRIIVNFNHPLAGKKVTYSYKVLRMVEDKAEQITSFLYTTMRTAKKHIKVTLNDNQATIELPQALPEPISKAIGKKLESVTSLKEVKFTTPSK